MGVPPEGVPSSVTFNLSGRPNGDFQLGHADIIARTTKGLVKSELSQSVSENGHLLQTRLGNGARTLRLNSESGNITFSVLSNSRDPGAPAIRKSLEPALSEVPTKAAGTPAPSLDAQDVDEGDVVRVDSQLATLNLSVIDRETNRGVVGLTQSDFRLLKRRPATGPSVCSSVSSVRSSTCDRLSGSTRDFLN